jgi:hypothetical protein
MPRYLHAIKIEGLGDVTASATDKRYRICYARAFFDAPATADADGLFIDGLQMWPSELSADVDFRDGRATISNQTFTLRADSTTRPLLYRLRHGVVAQLIAAMTYSQTTIDVDTSGLNGAVYLERECLVIDGSSESSIAGGFRYDVTRAALGTTAQAHGADTTDDVEIFQTCNTLAGRLIQLLRVPLDSTDAPADEVVLWSGVIRDINTSDTGLSLTISADGLLALVDAQQIFAERSQGRMINALLDGQRPRLDRLSASLLIQDKPAAGSGVVSDPQQALFMLGDDAAIKGTYTLFDQGGSFFARLLADSETFAGRPLPDDMSVYKDTPTREVFSTRADSPSNVDSGSIGDNTLPLSSHPGKLILQLLTTTRNDNTAGPNGAYDTGINALAGSIPVGLVDVAGILLWGDEIGITLDDVFFFEDESRALGDVIREILTPLLSALISTPAGKLSIIRLKDSADYGSALSLSQSQVRSASIIHNRNLIDAIDKVQLSYRVEPGLPPSRISARDTIKYRRQPPGEHSSLSLTLRGTRRRDLATQVIQTIIQRYHDPIPMLFVECLPTAQFELGDVISVTHSLIPDGDGGRGRTGAPMLVISRREVFSGEPGQMGEHIMVYGLLDVGLIHPRAGHIAPSATVAASPAPTATVFTVNVNDFTEVDGSGPFDADVEGFAVGDAIDIMDEFGTPVDTGLFIQAIAGNQITLTVAASPAPSAGDIIRPSAYAQCVTQQQDDWIFIADADDELNTDLPKTYRS